MSPPMSATDFIEPTTVAMSQTKPTSTTPTFASVMIISPPTSPAIRAHLATTRRLVVALMNEKLLDGRVISIASGQILGQQAHPVFSIGLFPPTAPSSSSSPPSSPALPPAATADVPLLSFYALDVVVEGNRALFCDPEDFVVGLPVLVGGATVTDPVAIFDYVAPFLTSASEKSIPQIRLELESSRNNQEMSYARLKEAPAYSAPSLVWEQAVIEGHSVHPMHRSRLGLDADQRRRFPAEFDARIDIHFVSMPTKALTMNGPFKDLLGDWCPPAPSPDHTVVPIHEGQWQNLVPLFPEITKMPDARPAKALTSMRSVAPEDLRYDLKFALAVYTTSAMRTISPYSVFNGPRIGEIAKLLAPPTLKILDEMASVGSNDPNPAVSKHLACIIRERPEVAMPEYHHIMSGALVERDIHGVPNVISAFQLDTEAKRESFLFDYIRAFLDCFIPPLLKGLAFEAHGQNALLRVNKQGEIVGFSVRDFGGVMYHSATVKKHTGVEVTLLEGSSIVAETMDDAHRVFFHAGINSNLHRMIRALGLHRNGKGWDMVRSELTRHLGDDPLLTKWLQPSVLTKSLFSMKLGGLYRDFLYYQVPNYMVRRAASPVVGSTFSQLIN